MPTVNRVMRFYNNPKARGFLINVLEETERNDDLGIIKFKVIASETAGTKKKANAIYARLQSEYIINAQLDA